MTVSATQPGTSATQTDLQCPECGGQRLFDVDSQGLRCQSCGALSAVLCDPFSRPDAEWPFDPETPADEDRVRRRMRCTPARPAAAR